jgi:hypothetical protein
VGLWHCSRRYEKVVLGDNREHKTDGSETHLDQMDGDKCKEVVNVLYV